MATVSVIGGVIDLWGLLAFTPKPALYFDEATLDRTNTTVISYVVLHDDGTSVTYDVEYHPYETTKFRFDVYAPTRVLLEAIVTGIRYDTGGVTGRLGFDFTERLPVTGLDEIDVRRVREQRGQEPDRGVGGALVQRCTMSYEVTGVRTA